MSAVGKLGIEKPSPEPPLGTATAIFFSPSFQWKEPPPTHNINTGYRKLGQISGNWWKKMKKGKKVVPDVSLT